MILESHEFVSLCLYFFPLGKSRRNCNECENHQILDRSSSPDIAISNVYLCTLQDSRILSASFCAFVFYILTGAI